MNQEQIKNLRLSFVTNAKTSLKKTVCVCRDSNTNAEKGTLASPGIKQLI